MQDSDGKLFNAGECRNNSKSNRNSAHVKQSSLLESDSICGFVRSDEDYVRKRRLCHLTLDHVIRFLKDLVVL